MAFSTFTEDFFFDRNSLVIIHCVAWKLAACSVFNPVQALVNLIAESIDAVYNLKVARDWFNYCTTIPNVAFR